jgi:hypothetical protein
MQREARITATRLSDVDNCVRISVSIDAAICRRIRSYHAAALRDRPNGFRLLGNLIPRAAY